MRRLVSYLGSPLLQITQRSTTVLILGVLVGAFATITPVPSRAANASASLCWVEFKFSSPIHKLTRYGVSFPSFENFDRYAVVTNPAVPDYRYGQTTDKILWYQFLASCEDSKEAIAVLAGDSMKRKWPPKVTSMTVRPSKPGDLSRVKSYLERPKFWLRDCIVAIEAVNIPLIYPPVGKKLLDYLAEYTKTRQDVFAPSSWTADHGNSRVYIQFLRSCDRRVEMVRGFLTAYRQNYDNGWRYRVLERKFDPYSMQSWSKGPYWLDYYFPDGPPK